MAKFTPAMLIPANQVEGFTKGAAQRTTTQVALDNINKMKEQWAAGDAAEGKKNFTLVGDRVAFTVRVNNVALVLETLDVNGTKVEVKEMSAPRDAFSDALSYYADRIKAGEYEAQLTGLSEKRTARTEKMRATRAAKPKEAKPAK